jgi:hypothetical protein
MVSKLTMDGCNFDNNGEGGIRVEGDDVELHLKNTNARGNGGPGLHLIPHAQVMREWNLPVETDPEKLLQLLRDLRDADKGAHQNIVAGSGVVKEAASGILNMSTLISNILTIAASPLLPAVIARLSGG